MKFSLFAGAACLVAGVFAAPQVQQKQETALVARADLYTTLAQDVANVQSLVTEITTGANAATDVTAALALAPKLEDLTYLLGNITNIVTTIASNSVAGTLGSVVGGVLQTVGNLVGGLLGTLGLKQRDDALGTAIQTLTGVLSTLSVTGLIGTLLTVVTGLVTTVTNLLAGLVDGLDPAASADVADLVKSLNTILTQLNKIAATVSST